VIFDVLETTDKEPAMERGQFDVGPGRRLIAALFTVLLLVTACGGADEDLGDEGAGPTDGGTNGEEGVADEGGTTSERDGLVGEPVYGGVFEYAQVGTQSPYDPLLRTADPIMNAVYDKLMRWGPDGTVEPYMAESLETEDAQTYVLRLREGITFHDGNPLDADAVIFNLERHMNPDNASFAASDLAPVDEITKVDDLTIEIALSAPNAAFAGVFTGSVGHIASPAAIEELGDDYGTTGAVGAGPFLFERWDIDQRAVVTRNDDYWQEGLPYLDEFHEIPMSDTQSRFAAFQAEEVDAAWFQEPREQQWARDNPDRATLYFPEGAVGGTGTVMNVQEPPFDDVRVREAVAYATNYEGLEQALFEGNMPRIKGPFDSTVWETDVEWPDHDLERARALVAEYEADTGNQVAFAFGCHTAPDRRRFAELMQQMLSQADMDVELRILDVAEYVDAVYGHDFQIGCFPKNGDDPDVFYESFHCDGPPTQNFFGYCNPEADAALEEGRTSLDFEDRQAAYAEWERIIREDVPMVWNWGPNFAFMTQDEVQGVVVNPATPTDWQVEYLWLPES